ncbi:MAG: delta-60 repeat domain-containing protein, partial [Bacteroidetes bacterium]|nr:delta-60 repeat domain-containing protein [Bacteroidota bacterium]
MTYPAIKKAAIAAVSILFATLHGFAQVGKLDNRYYINDGGNWSITKVLVLPDSSVLVGGNFSNFNGRPAKGLAKMGKDGTHDWSFGIGQGISGTDANVESMARQADGKIIVAGTFTGFGGNTCNRIVRLNADGSVDGSFVTGTGFNAPVMDVLVQPDSTILVAGQFSVYNGAYTGSTIARLMPNGSLDTSFHPYPSHWIYSMARQDDGKILVGGIYQTTSKALRRLHADGSLDTTFNSGGAGPGAGPTNLSVYKVGIVSGGRICITGAFPTYNGTPSSGIAILNPNGSPYSGFDPGTGFGHAQAWDFVEQADKKIVVVGNFGYYNGVVTNRIARIDSTGARDTAFALGSGFNDLCRGVALLPDGSLLAGGRFSLYNTYAQAFLAKIKPDGSPAMDLFPRLGLNGQVYAIAKQSNGKTILVGNFTRFNERPVRFIVRLEADGSLDTAFGGGTGANNAIRALVVLPDDKILVAGQFSQYDGNTKRLVALLEADGTLDNSYNMNLTGGGVAYCMAQVDGGKILVGGNFTLAAGNTRRGLLRLNADLTLDSPVLAGSTNYSVGSVVQQADGRIIFTGASAGLARLDTLGNIDTSFHIGTGAPNAGTITLQADGKVLVGGTFSQFNGTAAKGLVRLNTDGTLDSGFALNTGPGQASIWKIIPYGTGMLIGGTFTAYHGSPRYGLAYLDSTGALGTGFDAEAGVGGAFTPTVNALCHDSYTGRVLAGGLFTATATGMPRRNFAAFTGEFDGIAIDSIRIDTLLCAGGTAKVVFKKVKPFNSGNVFTVLLSDSTGSFANPVAIGSKEAEGMGWDTVDAVIPSGMPQANGYKVKVISTNAANTSNPSNKFMVGKPLPPSVPGGSQTVCTADTAHTFIFDSIRVGSGGDKIIWSLTENFLVSDTIDNYDSISVTVLGFGADTVWLKSWNMAANLLSKTSFVTACKGRIPDTKSYHTMELALKDSAVAVSIYQSQLGVKYKLKLIDTYIDSTLGTGDTIVIRSNAISTNKSFVLIAYDTLSQCERIIDTISVKAFTFNPVDYSRATLYAQPDKSYFQIRQEIQSYIDSLHIYKALKKEEDTEEEEEDDVSRNFSRWVDFWDARVDKDGSIKASTEAMFDYLHPTVPNDCGESAFDPKWKCIGPFESNANRIQNQGRVIEITANPLNHSTIYMGSNSGGIWKTYDEGANWINVTDNDGYGGMGFTSIAINPEDTNHILAATGKNLPGTWVDGSDDAYTIGVIESLDGGASWHTTPISFDPSSSWSAEAPPYSPDLVLSKKVWFEPNPALGDITYYAITELQLYRVTNDVKTLLYEPPQQCGAYAYRILDAKQDNGFIYLSIYAYGPLLGCSTVVGNVPDIWVYDLSNNTVTTDIRDNFNYTLSNATIADSNLAQIRISTTNTRNINGDARLFAMLDYTTITTPQETQVVFSHSDDRGETWSVPVVTNNPLNIGFTDFIVSPNNENVIYVEGRSNPFRLMARSIDGGATFLAMPQTNIHVDVRAYKIYNPSPHEASMTTAWTGDGLLMGNDGGPAIKRIGGAWEPINGRGLTIGKYYGLGIDHENIHTTIAGAQDGSISGNVEGKWQTCNEGIGDRGDCINFEGSTDWLESWNWNLQLSQRNVPDNCATAGTFAYPSIGRGFRNFTLFPITQDPRDSNNIYIGWDNVASGVNQFSTTHAQDLDLTSITTYQASSIFRIRALSVAYDQSNERAVYYSLNDKDWGGNGGVNWGIYKLDEQTGVSTDISGSLYSSTDNTAPLRHAVITDIANEPDNAEHIFITFGNFQSGKKVFETTDDGETWTNITGCLPNFPANSILYQKEADRLIVGTDVGVYYRDASTSYIWKKMKGLPDVPIYDMELHECGQMLKVATYGRSIWEAYLPPLSELSIATNTTWNSNKDITQTVRIQPNTVLTVTNGAVINMARGTNIIVSIGAKLIVEEGSIITNGCGAMWDGIIMEGNKNEPQNLSSNNNNTAT